jgi:uncharacterized membrane protein
LQAHPLVQRLRPALEADLPTIILAVAIGVWTVVFGTLVVLRHNRFDTFDHDLGIWDQAVWLLARGQSLITVRGLDVFGFHASPALYLFVPFSWLGAGPNVLNLAMTASLAAGAVAVYRIGRHHLANDWFAAQWMVWETFHPEVIAIGALLFAYLAAVQGRWRAYALWLVLAVAWKEDVALAAVMLGALLALRGRNVVGQWAAARNGQPRPPGPAATRRVGIITAVLAIAWFLVATKLLIPAFSPGGNFTEALFGDLGTTPAEMVRTAVTDPGILRQHLHDSNPVGYGRELFGSFGFVPLLSPMALLLGLPQVLINSLAVYDFFWTTRVHYAALPLFATTVAAVEGVARVHRRGLRRALVGAVAVGAFFTAVTWGISPLSPQYEQGYWPQPPPAARQAELERAISRPGPDESVSAGYYLVPHLTHRSAAYTFPNPWMASNWGVEGENTPDPRVVDWLILDPTALTDDERPLLVDVLADPDRPLAPGTAKAEAVSPEELARATDPSRWELLTNDPSLLVARRVR